MIRGTGDIREADDRVIPVVWFCCSCTRMGGLWTCRDALVSLGCEVPPLFDEDRNACVTVISLGRCDNRLPHRPEDDEGWPSCGNVHSDFRGEECDWQPLLAQLLQLLERRDRVTVLCLTEAEREEDSVTDGGGLAGLAQMYVVEGETLETFLTLIKEEGSIERESPCVSVEDPMGRLSISE